MKYRIVKYYGRYAVQRKTIFGWIYVLSLELLLVLVFPVILTFHDLEAAEKYVSDIFKRRKDKAETGKVVKEF